MSTPLYWRGVCADKLALIRDATRAISGGAVSPGLGPPLPHSRMNAIARRLTLSADAVDFLWTACAVTCDPEVSNRIAALHGPSTAGVSFAGFALLADMSDERAWALVTELSREHPLIASGLLASSGDGTSAGARISAHVDVVRYLLGELAHTSPYVRRVEPEGLIQFDEHSEIETVVATAIAEPCGRVVLCGARDSGRTSLVARLASDRDVFVTDLEALAHGPMVRAAVLRRILLADRDVVLVLRDLGGTRDHASLFAVHAWLADLPCPVVVAGERDGSQLERRAAMATLPPLGAASRARLWRHGLASMLDSSTKLDADAIASRFRLEPGSILRACAAVQAVCADGAAVTDAAVVQAIRRTVHGETRDLIERIESRDRWSDVVLGTDTVDEIRALLGRVRHSHRVLDDWGFRARLARGGGIAALFSGPPGTGKTMIAGLIAQELGLELYMVDLSKVVSKWIGETEKQLGRAFDAAEAGQALLLFDEADALFAKRTEVRSSNDRYANLEVNYLLQRIEAFGGLTILTTNNESAIDPAIKRRLATHIAFSAPDHDERCALWERMLPADAPRAPDLNYDALAKRFSALSGAHIRNAVVAAGFLAASEDSVIEQRHLEWAARAEYRTQGRVMS